MSESNLDPESSNENTENRPSISPGTKPKVKVTQSPFSPNLRPASGSEAGASGASKPKPEAPKPAGLKPSTLSPADAIQPAGAAPGMTDSLRPSTPEPTITFDDDDEEEVMASGSSVGEYVQLGLQGVGAIAAIVFTVLAVMENMPFL